MSAQQTCLLCIFCLCFIARLENPVVYKTLLDIYRLPVVWNDLMQTTNVAKHTFMARSKKEKNLNTIYMTLFLRIL